MLSYISSAGPRLPIPWVLGPAGVPRPQGEGFVLRNDHEVTMKGNCAVSAVIRTSIWKSSSSDSDDVVDGRTGEGIRSSAGIQPADRMGGGAEPLRNEAFESMLFSSHWRSSMRRSLLCPADPLMDLHFLRRDCEAAIQESGTHTSGMNNDTKSSECLHTQLPKQTRHVQLSGISPQSGARLAGESSCRSSARPSGLYQHPPDPE